jgi:hypothetical protein
VKRAWPYLALGAVLVTSLVLGLLLVLAEQGDPDDDAEGDDVAAPSVRAGDDPEPIEDWWPGGEPEERSQPVGAQAYGKQGEGPLEDERRRRWEQMTPEERDARRAAWAERRRARFLRSTQIDAIGGGEPGIDPGDVFEAFREVRPVVRGCIREAGGFRELTGQSPRARGPRTLTFDVDAAGRVVADTIAIEPAMGSAMGDCFAAGLAQAELPAPGGEGARISVELPGRRRRGGDAGIGFGRRRPRSDLRPPNQQ